MCVGGVVFGSSLLNVRVRESFLPQQLPQQSAQLPPPPFCPPFNIFLGPRAGSYECKIFVFLAQIHFPLDDVETSYPGFQIYSVASDGSKIPQLMYWDDENVQVCILYLCGCGQSVPGHARLDALLTLFAPLRLRSAHHDRATLTRCRVHPAPARGVLRALALTASCLATMATTSRPTATRAHGVASGGMARAMAPT